MFCLYFVHTFRMIILYILLIAYIVAINFYAFLYVKSLRDQERKNEDLKQAEPLSAYDPYGNPNTPISSENNVNSGRKTPDRNLGKLIITGALGGAISIYVCMFVFKYKRSDLLLMVLMPLLGVLNVYLWVLLFKSGFSFFILR